MAASRANRRPDDDDESSDDEGSGAGTSAPRAGIPTQWKADVRSMVQEFAKEERGRGRAAGGGARPSSDPGSAPGEATQRKPPRAPQPRHGTSDNGPPAEEPQPKKAPARQVDFTPATVDEYKAKYGAKGEVQEMGVLGPDLDDEALLMKKAMKEKVNQFSKELGRVNRTRVEKAPARPKPKPKAEPTTRDKMLEFAKNVPKPKPEPRPALVVDKQTASPSEIRQRAKDSQLEEKQDDWEEIRRREKQHFEDVAKVEEIKAFMRQLNV